MFKLISQAGGQSTNFCKGPEDSYFRPADGVVSHAAALHRGCHPAPAAPAHEWAWLCSNKLYLQALKFKFHTLFMRHKIVLFWFFQRFKM